MACDICGRGNCTTSFHSVREQQKFADVIDAFERARDLRDRIMNEPDEEEEELEAEDEQEIDADAEDRTDAASTPSEEPK